ncbi:MAG: 7-cyano-7-deazaguanine synthase QueC [Candidatus Omnitrophica bacterium]|nr:7-cyano-7-deazaguanine synthase QueC [Candidatus Omnitrophota bacterium]
MKKAIVLLSGGLDSATTLFYAKKKGFTPYCLIFDYGQRHRKEVQRAQRIARRARCRFRLIKISLPWQGSSLLDRKTRLPQHKRVDPNEIPSTYVPARNIIFLSFAVSFAEAVGARAVFIGANAVDYSGYPDCRPEFFEAYRKMLAKGSKTGVEGKAVQIHAPLVHKTKAQIIKLGLKLKVPYHLTWSCYQGGRRPCGRCDSCLLRKKGFETVNVEDPSWTKRR